MRYNMFIYKPKQGLANNITLATLQRYNNFLKIVIIYNKISQKSIISLIFNKST